MGWSDVQVSVVGVAGSTVTVSSVNPQSHSETFRVRVTVSRTDGQEETLTSSNVTLPAQGTRNVQLSAASQIASINEGPDPIAPMG